MTGRKTGTWIVILVVGGIAFIWSKRKVARTNTFTNIAQRKDTTIHHYHTFYASDSSGDLIGYILHQKESDDKLYLECSAIIKDIDPAKTDYKSICRDVISDIVRSSKTNQIVIHIFDDDTAYDVFEVKCNQHYGILDTNDVKLYGKHFIASFEGPIYDDYDPDVSKINFYQYGNDKYSESEFFHPKYED